MSEAVKPLAGKTFRIVDGDISDGYHTFDELYAHRITLWIALCRVVATASLLKFAVWRSWLHSDGSSFDGWFVLGIGKAAGTQMTYHLPRTSWEACGFAEELERAPEFDGHTSADVLARIARL